jgi:hypothetical protein
MTGPPEITVAASLFGERTTFGHLLLVCCGSKSGEFRAESPRKMRGPQQGPSSRDYPSFGDDVAITK